MCQAALGPLRVLYFGVYSVGDHYCNDLKRIYTNSTGRFRKQLGVNTESFDDGSSQLKADDSV